MIHPKDSYDARLKKREIQLINKIWITTTNFATNPLAVDSCKNKTPFDDEELNEHKTFGLKNSM